MRVEINVDIRPDGYTYQKLADETVEVSAPVETLRSLRWTELVASLVERTLEVAEKAEAEQEEEK